MPIILTIAALVLDAIIGDPQSWPHPVRLIGRMIVFFERLCRLGLSRLRGRERLFLLFGVFLGLAVTSLTGLAVWLVLTLASKAFFFFWFAAALYLTFAIFCLKDLRNHVERVEKALNEADLEGARRSLSWIVGRDTANLTPEGIRRATVETIAENFSDGLVAPLLYLAFGGPVLAWIYKAVNTLDSMVGYKNEQYFFLGRFSARLDDLANFIPSRLAALLLVAAAKILHLNATLAFRLWRLEGRFHSSPNSGQTEAAMAGALNVFLGGPNYYSGQLIDKPAINRDGTSATKESVQSAMNMVEVASILALVMAVIIETALLFFFEIPCGWGLSF